MSRHRSVHIASVAILLAACALPAARESPLSPSAGAAVAAVAPAALRPPRAASRPHTVRALHGAERSDEYYWLRDDERRDPDVLAYLRAENDYADAVLAPLAASRELLYAELVARQAPADSSVPYRYRGYWHTARYLPGQAYALHVRRRDQPGAPEQVVLDENQQAAGDAYYELGNWETTPDQRLVAYAEDTVGRLQYRIRIKDLSSGRVLPEQIEGASAELMWADDNRTLYYVENDPETLLGRRVRAHRVGTPVAQDRVIYEEADDSYFLGLLRTRSERFLCIDIVSAQSAEMRCTEAAQPDANHPGEFRVLAPRQPNVDYQADHLGGQWLIRSNWDAPDYRLMQLADDQPWGDRDRWRELVAHVPGVFIDGFELFDGFIAIAERSGGLERLRIRPWRGPDRPIQADESAYAMALDINAEPGSDWLRYTYTSLTTPETTYEFNVVSGERRLLKRQPVLGGYDPARFRTERLWVRARDGARVPVTLLMRADHPIDGRGALYQTAYGAYGEAVQLDFDSSVISLVERGVVYAIAHVRGGQELGRRWYDAGRLANKGNSFSDFIDVTDALVERGYAAPGRVAAMGASAGGLVMGAVANMAPERYRVIVAHVPFVDVVTTMLDPSIPLTTNEYQEWGDPADPAVYARLLGYSPYDQVRRQAYPAMLVSTSLWDSAVQYYEPAKWVARLRAHKTDGNPLLLRTDLQAGHSGRSGRFEPLRQRAEEYAFVLDRLGIILRP